MYIPFCCSVRVRSFFLLFGSARTQLGELRENFFTKMADLEMCFIVGKIKDGYDTCVRLRKCHGRGREFENHRG